MWKKFCLFKQKRKKKRSVEILAQVMLECTLLQAVLEETHTRTVRSCAWSPSGRLLATASFDATTAIWENVGGDFECVSTLEVYFYPFIACFLFLKIFQSVLSKIIIRLNL